MIVAIISDKTVVLLMVQKILPFPLLPSVRNFMISAFILPQHFDEQEGPFIGSAAS